MKKYIAFLLCLIMIMSLFSCDIKDGNNTDLSENNTSDSSTNPSSYDNTDDSTNSVVEDKTPTDTPSNTESTQNELARQAYGMAIRNEINIYYPLIDVTTPRESYFERIRGREKGNPSRQAMVDMDKDGIKELILAYDNFLILLHFENDVVYGTDFDLESMETIYTDGSFSWSNTDDIFGYEYGISRVSFVNGIHKTEELCRTEGDSKFFISGVQVTKEQYNDYVNNVDRTPIKFTPFDTSFLDSNELKAIELASAHWNIKDGDFDSERGFRYRIICSGKMGNLYRVSLYRFVYNSYYEHLEIASVNIETGEISTSEYPDGKG